MKKLFFSAFALALSAFAFVSCNDDDKITDNGDDGGRFLTLAEQQRAITNAMDGVADAIEFTEFSYALDVIKDLSGVELNYRDFFQILGSPAVQEDSIFQEKLAKAVMIISQDTIAVDLSPFYMSADLFISDTLLIDTITSYGEGGEESTYVDSIIQPILVLDNIKHDVNYLQLNVYVADHKFSFKANVKAGESVICYTEEEGGKTVYLPKSAELSLTVDDKSLISFNGEYTSDMSLYVQDVKGGDDIVEFEGTQFSVSGKIKVVSYELAGGVKFDINKGIETNLAAKYADKELLSVSAKLDAVFEGLDIQDTTAILVWAQNPEKLKSISLNASMGGGKVVMKGSLESPFKDEALATTLRSLMVPGASITEEKAKETVEQLNAIIDAGIYFEGFNQPQAKFKFVFREIRDRNKGRSVFDKIGELFDRAGACPVFIVHDENGNEVEVMIEDYFEKIDYTNMVGTIKEKFEAAFGEFIEEMNSDKKK